MDMKYITTIQKNDEYTTPSHILKNFCKSYDIPYPKLDVAARADNTKCSSYYTIENNALDNEWDEPYFCNSPYSRIEEFLKYGLEQTKKHNVLGIFLLFAKTDTKYWSEFIFPHSRIIWVKGRIQFPTAAGLNRRCYKCKGYTNLERCPTCGIVTAIQNSPYGSAWVLFYPGVERPRENRHDVVDRDGFRVL